MGDPLDYVDELDFNTRKFPPTHHMVENFDQTQEKKVRICRCWQSKKFPYCDDTHKVMIEAGDNVGPFVAQLRSMRRQPQPVSAVQRLSATAAQPRLAAGVMLAVAGGYIVSDVLLGSKGRIGGRVVGDAGGAAIDAPSIA